LSYTKFAYNGLNIHVDGKVKRAEESVAATSTTAASAPHPMSIVSQVAPSTLAKPNSTITGTVIVTTSAVSSTPTLGGTVVISNQASITSNATAVNATLTTSANVALSPPSVITSPVQHSPGGPTFLYDTAITVSYRITNTGKVDGNEVSQVYLTFPPSANSPPRVLRGFDRTLIKHGQTAAINVKLRKKDVSMWDVVTQQWVVPSGEFTVQVGASSRDIRMTGTVALK